MKKFRFLGLICLALVLCTILMVNTSEASAETSGYYTYTVTDGNATITKCDPSISGEIAIPVMLDGYPVTAIGYQAFYGCKKLTAVTIPKT